MELRRRMLYDPYVYVPFLHWVNCEGPLEDQVAHCLLSIPCWFPHYVLVLPFQLPLLSKTLPGIVFIEGLSCLELFLQQYKSHRYGAKTWLFQEPIQRLENLKSSHYVIYVAFCNCCNQNPFLRVKITLNGIWEKWGLSDRLGSIKSGRSVRSHVQNVDKKSPLTQQFQNEE